MWFDRRVGFVRLRTGTPPRIDPFKEYGNVFDLVLPGSIVNTLAHTIDEAGGYASMFGVFRRRSKGRPRNIHVKTTYDSS